MRGCMLVLLVSACGRVGFEGTQDPTGDGGGSQVMDGLLADSTGGDPCAAGDGVCRVSCLGSDPDCTTVCGDGVCVGNAGELCTTCADCDTRSPTVCGNAQCDPGEDSDVCYADCGPSPWQWTAQEQQVLDLLNAARTSGTGCPGGGGTMTAPSVLRGVPLDLGAREWAWENTHHQLPSGDSCNGRTFIDRATAAGATAPYAAWVRIGDPSPDAAVTGWLNDRNPCLTIMDGGYTRVGIGVADDVGAPAYVIIFD